MLVSLMWFVVKLLSLCEQYEQLVVFEHMREMVVQWERGKICHGRNLCNLLN